MQTIIKDRKVQHIEGDKISRKQKIFLQILKILKAAVLKYESVNLVQLLQTKL